MWGCWRRQVQLDSAHRNIAISGNTITGCTMPGILVTSTADLRVGQNTLGQWTDSLELPELMRRSGLRELAPVVKIHCLERNRGVSMKKNLTQMYCFHSRSR